MPETKEPILYDLPVSPLMLTLWERLPDWAYIWGQVADILDPKVETISIEESQEMLERYQWEYILSRFIESEFSIAKLRIRIARNPENGNYTITHQWTGQKCPIRFFLSEKEVADNVDYSKDEMSAYLPMEDLRKLLEIVENTLGENAPKNMDDTIRNIIKEKRLWGLLMDIRLHYMDSTIGTSGKIAQSLPRAVDQILQRKNK